jgi:flagellar basal body-associated protein FliL
MPDIQVTGVTPSVARGSDKSSADLSDTASPSDQHRARSRGQSGTLYISLGVVAISIVAYLLFRSAPNGVSSHAEGEATLNLDTFIVNLESGNQRAYLRVGITLGLSQPLARKDEVLVPPLRDEIVTVLSSAQPDQLLTSEGKQQIKKDLLKALQDRAPALGIENVYFTEFLVQM